MIPPTMTSLGALVLALSSFALPAVAQLPSNYTNAFKQVSLSAPDGSIKASFMQLGATITHLLVRDRHGAFRDVVLGYDNTTLYLTDPGHPYFGPIVGRYANRIANGTFTIPTSNPVSSNVTVYHVPENENNGTDTLHGGIVGFDRRVFTVANLTKSSVTFEYIDVAGTEGFPGTVHTTVTYTLLSGSKWHTTMHATATEKTPILLSSHVYWNLEAFKESQDILSHKLWIDSSRVIGANGQLIPTGALINVTGTAYDFRTSHTFGERMNQTAGYCGTGCVGLDNAWIYDQNHTVTPAVAVWSPLSGIKLTVTTDQPALQIYTCNGIASANITRKAVHSGPGKPKTYGLHECFVMEQEGWIGGINQPEWPVDQIYGPDRDFNWDATYSFTTLK